jgi:hypothetical protein
MVSGSCVRQLDEPSERAIGRARGNGVASEGEAVCDGGHDAGDMQRGGGVQEGDVQHGAGSSGQHFAGDGYGVCQGAGLELRDGCSRQAEGGGIQLAARDRVPGYLERSVRRGCAELVEAVVRSHDQRAGNAETRQRCRELRRVVNRVRAHKLARRACGVHQRTKEIEDGREAELLPNGRGVPGGGMMIGGVREAEPDLGQAACLRLRWGVDADAKGLEQFGGTSPRTAPIAMLGDKDPSRGGGSGDDGTQRGDVEELGGAAGAAGVQDGDRRSGDGDAGGAATHGAGRANEFIDGRTARGDGGENRGDVGLADAPGEDRGKERIGIGIGEGPTDEKGPEDVAGRVIHGQVIGRNDGGC